MSPRAIGGSRIDSLVRKTTLLSIVNFSNNCSASGLPSVTEARIARRIAAGNLVPPEETPARELRKRAWVSSYWDTSWNLNTGRLVGGGSTGNTVHGSREHSLLTIQT